MKTYCDKMLEGGANSNPAFIEKISVEVQNSVEVQSLEEVDSSAGVQGLIEDGEAAIIGEEFSFGPYGNEDEKEIDVDEEGAHPQ